MKTSVGRRRGGRRPKRKGSESGASLNRRPYDVAYALVRAASSLNSTLGFEFVSPKNKCRDESRHGTHECVRHNTSAAARSRGRIRKSPPVTAQEMDAARTVGARVRELRQLQG